MSDPDGLRHEIVSAAIERHKAQQRLEKAGRERSPSWTMRQRQRDVSVADRKLADAAEQLADLDNGRG